MIVIPDVVKEFRHEIVVSIMVSGFLGGVMYPFRKIKEGWKNTQAKLDAVSVELTTQRTNCLTTLQRQGDAQIEILKDVSQTLRDMHLDQKELLGRVK
jgi:hypothetical protein